MRLHLDSLPRARTVAFVKLDVGDVLEVLAGFPWSSRGNNGFRKRGPFVIANRTPLRGFARRLRGWLLRLWFLLWFRLWLRRLRRLFRLVLGSLWPPTRPFLRRFFGNLALGQLVVGVEGFPVSHLFGRPNIFHGMQMAKLIG